ncbi:MAG TPA: DUF2934 domain-containing protein [Candidatus Acidoferrales bacterium]|nr:DUF2934 domain-containing protein [Candidatus Acidoferrales bacterium]
MAGKRSDRTQKGVSTREQIEKRAHEIYMKRGGADGHDVDDWLAAEQQLDIEESFERGLS